MSLVPLIPIVILISTVGVYLLLGPSLKVYLGKAEEKTRRVQRISTLIIASDIVTFFSKSESSKVVERLLKMAKQDDSDLYDFLDKSVLNAEDEIGKLHEKLKQRDEQVANLSKIRMSTMFIRSTVLIYGVTISAIQFVLIYLFYSSNISLFLLINGVFFGGSILFSVILVFLIVYAGLISRKLDMDYMTLLKEPADHKNLSNQ
ncbi:MAG: hypothetical protein M0T81_00870 [Thermoplasmatales archaeon]|jgi:hypothetical protein|nr:hypothetical protein [Thermoplasmatales archaeon]